MPTFRQILASMMAHLQEKGSKLTDFSPTSVVYQLLSAIASVIDQIQYSIEKAQKQAYVSTATDQGLDAKGQDLGVPRKQSTPARWVFTFSKKQVSAQLIPIPQGTIITTLPQPGMTPITFRVDESSYLPVGTQSVQVAATCSQPGSIGNLAMNTPLMIGSATPGIDGVQLLSLEQGTAGFDTEADDEYRKRLLSALASKAQGTLTWYEQTALSVEGVQLAKVVPFERGPGTVNIYIVAEDNQVPSSDLIGKVQKVIDAGRLITDDAKVVAPAPRYIDLEYVLEIAPGYARDKTFERVEQQLREYVNGLGIGGGPTGTLYLTQLIKTILLVEGVLNVPEIATADGGDLHFAPFQMPQLRDLIANANEKE